VCVCVGCVCVCVCVCGVCVCVCVCVCVVSVCVCVCGVKTLKSFNLYTAGESVTPTSLLTLITAGPLECYVVMCKIWLQDY